MKILISDSAFNDLEAIKEYYLREGVPQIGTEFVIKIIRHIETLENNPETGRKVPEFNEKNIRELIHPPFRIVYLREEKTINVIRVWRSERLLNLTGTPANKKI
ncbi:Death on curing protein, Doc toxin [hydrothermal vent metagenome]|uniref:Death on curing protein, Doc toxin n=1 Tax=hydrothermal vent metagenome TaxID=652676 RepID=A0A3B0X825_9ZZZZ